MLTLLTLPFSLIAALLKVISTTRYRSALSVPFLIGLISFVLSFLTIWQCGAELLPATPTYLYSWIPDLILNWLTYFLGFIAEFLGVIICIALSSFVSLLITILIANFYLEIFVERVLVDHKLIRDDGSYGDILKALARGLIEDCKKIIFVGIFTILLFVGGFIPILIPLVFLCGAYLVGFDIVDLPFRLSGKKFFERWRLAKANWGFVLSLGGIFTLLLAIPFATLILLPAAYLLTIEKLLERK